MFSQGQIFTFFFKWISQSVSSVTQSWLTLCEPMDCSTPGFYPQHPKLLAQTHVPCPLSSPSPPAFSLSQHQGFSPLSQFFSSGGQSIGVSASASVLHEYSELISFRMDWLDLLAVQGLSRVFSNTTVQKHQFFSAQLSLWFNSHIHTRLLEKT